MSRKIGFDVAHWESKPMREYTNEELLEYWLKMRLSLLGKSEQEYTASGMYTIDLQKEILGRMKEGGE